MKNLVGSVDDYGGSGEEGGEMCLFFSSPSTVLGSGNRCLGAWG